ncbi:MAG: dihydroneopterin aldolase [Verrucomicrobia bacterium]|nr:MAG: dihydroneopterin aldolase [Verrucomicrobiota bacterium]
MSKIKISELEVFYCVGVSDEERAKPQRLMVTVDMSYDFSSASVSDRVEKTINYHEVAKEVLRYGEGRSWKLLERLAANLSDHIMAKYKPQAVLVELKKFPIPQAQYVSVTLTKTQTR